MSEPSLPHADPGDAAAPPKRTRRPTARSAMPVEIRDRYTETPQALMEHAGAIGLSFADVGFVLALQSFGWFAGAAINPSMETLADRSGVSIDTVSRQVRRLEKRGLLGVQRDRRQAVRGYSLGPLWEALAAVVRESHEDARPKLTVVSEARNFAGSARESAVRVRESADHEHANLRTEVEEGVDEGEVDEGRTRALARDAPPPTPIVDEVAAQVAALRAKAADSETYASKAVELLREANRLEAGSGGRPASRWDQHQQVMRTLDLMAATPEPETIESTAFEVEP